jgi:hypothetical protein
MDPNAIFYTLVLFGTAGLAGGIALYAFRRTDRPGARTFGWFLLALTEWSVLYGIVIIVPSISAKLLVLKWQYLSVSAIGPLWLALSLTYNGRADLLKGRNYILLAAPIAISSSSAYK